MTGFFIKNIYAVIMQIFDFSFCIHVKNFTMDLHSMQMKDN